MKECAAYTKQLNKLSCKKKKKEKILFQQQAYTDITVCLVQPVQKEKLEFSAQMTTCLFWHLTVEKHKHGECIQDMECSYVGTCFCFFN